MTSPLCTVNNLSTVNGVDLSASASVTIQLIDDTGVDYWSIQCLYTDDLHSAATVNSGLSINNVTKTATFTMPSSPCALIFQSQVNNGRDVNGNVVNTYTTKFEIHVKTAGNVRVLAYQETNEASQNFGWITKINTLIRNPSGTVQDLASVLSQGNDTGGYSIQMSSPGVYTSAAGNDTIINASSGQGVQVIGDVSLLLSATTTTIQSNDGYIQMDNHIDMNSHRIIELSDPVNPQDAATKAYVDDMSIPLDVVLNNGNSTGGNNIVFSNDAAIEISSTSNNFNIAYNGSTSGNGRDVAISAQSSNAGNGNGGNIVLTPGSKNGSGTDGYVKISNSLNMNNSKITNLATPTVSTDAANKAYVDSHSAGTQNLKTTLGYGNVTDGYNIVISTGDKLTGQTSLSLESTGGYAVDIRSVGSNTIVTGDNLVVNAVLALNDTLDAQTNSIINVVDPVNAQDAATKAYVDSQSTLHSVLSRGNTTDGYDIVISSTDQITSTQNLNLVSNTGFAINLNSPSSYIVATGNNFVVNAVTVLGDSLDAQTNPIVNVPDPVNPQDAATKAYVDSHGGGGSQTLKQTLALGNVTDGYNVVVSNGDTIMFNQSGGALSSDATTLKYGFSTAVGIDGNHILLQGQDALLGNNGDGGSIYLVPGAGDGSGADGMVLLYSTVKLQNNNLDANTNKIINLGTPSASTDAATKGYVDSNTILSGATAGGDLTGTYPNPTIGSNKVTNAKFRQSGALSVVGRSANSSGDVADISASTDGYVLIRQSSSVLFGEPNFADRNITTTGMITLGGGNVATTGLINTAHNKTILSVRNNANSQTISAITWGVAGTDILQIGDGTTNMASVNINAGGSSNPINLQLAGSTRMQVTPSQVLLTGGCNTFGFTSAPGGTCTIQIGATSTTGVQPLVIQGHSTTNTSGTAAGKVSIKGGNQTGASGTRVGGDVAILAGTGTTANGNIVLGAADNTAWNSMQGGIFIGNGTAPSGNPTSGGYLYVESGALKYRGSGGTVTTIANA